MCGIAGIYHRDGTAADVRTLRLMADCLRHRGPDDEGYALFDARSDKGCYLKGPDSAADLTLPDVRDEPLSGCYNLALAERRLAILDLTSAAHTPMVTADGALAIVFNGEIYNFVELRAELAHRGHRFHSDGDTEVLLTAYREWGAACVSRLNGMWAFAIWDAAKQLLFCSRDRFGVKPFYYVAERSLFAFASEPKALWRSGLIPPKPNPTLLVDFLAGYEASRLDETMFEGIRQLPGGHNLIVTPDGLHRERYWSLPCNTELGPVRLSAETIREVGERLCDAVRLRLRSDVPVGTCLSGGLDSTAIVCLANDLMQGEHDVPRRLVGEHQKTFTACYDDPASDERDFARLVVERTGADWHQTFPTAEGLKADLERFIWHHDEPPITTSIYAQWCVMRLAREQGVTVTLDGQGSDELLAGYLPFDIYLAQVLRTGRVDRLASEAAMIAKVGSRPLGQVLLRAAANHLPTFLRRKGQARAGDRMLGLRADLAEEAIARHQIAFQAGSESNLARHLSSLTTHNLPRLLRTEDRNSMAFSVEARTPFLDVRFAELVAGLPASYRIHRGWSKYALRKALDGLVPAEICWRRDKKGFATPERAWLRALRPTLVELFHDAPKTAPHLDLPKLRAVLRSDEGTKSAAASAAIWRCAAAELWLRGIA